MMAFIQEFNVSLLFIAILGRCYSVLRMHSFSFGISDLLYFE
ncbi:MAG: hypothetical protein R6U96_03040 [Promethearchaeia archaeon]